MVNNKKQKIKKIKKEPEYRTKQQRQNEVKILISKINELHLTTEYKAIQEFYNLMFKYKSYESTIHYIVFEIDK